MSSPEREPFLVERPYADPQTVSEIGQNDVVDIHNAREIGIVCAMDAKQEMDSVEEMLAATGDGWFDRYGPPPPELAFLFEDERPGGEER